MNIQQLEYLIAVDKYKHFGKAARACFISQPTLSSMVQRFEEEFEVKVFDRTSHPIRTTDIGVQLISHAKKVVDAVMDLRNTASLFNNVLSGKLNIGIIPTISSFILPTEIFEFLNVNSKIEMNVREMTTDNVIGALKSGEIDAGIIATPYSETLEFFSDFLFNEELMLYSANEGNNDKKEDKYLVPKDIDINRFWLLEEGNCFVKQDEIICQLKENTLKPRNLEFMASNINTLIGMVDKVGGITILPELAISLLSNEQKKRVTRFVKPFPMREISMIYYKPTYKQEMLDEFVNYIKKALSPRLNYNKTPKNYFLVKPQ